MADHPESPYRSDFLPHLGALAPRADDGVFRPSLGALAALGAVAVPAPPTVSGERAGPARIFVTEIDVGFDLAGKPTEAAGQRRRMSQVFGSIAEARAFILGLRDEKKLVVIAFGGGAVQAGRIVDQGTFTSAMFETQAQAWAPIGKAAKVYKKWRFDIE